MKPTRTSVQFGRALHRLRTQAGLTQDALAKLSRVEQNHISKLERGERLPSWRTMRCLVSVLDSAEELLLL